MGLTPTGKGRIHGARGKRTTVIVIRKGNDWSDYGHRAKDRSLLQTGQRLYGRKAPFPDIAGRDEGLSDSPQGRHLQYQGGQAREVSRAA